MVARVMVLTGYGINCDEETAFAFSRAGGEAKIVHVNDLISEPQMLAEFQILAFPGGFSYGDDTGSGNALANKIRNNVWGALMRFVDEGKLIIGICNGFQVIANLGLLPAIGGRYGDREIALTYNDTARYECRWVSLLGESKKCVFTKGISGLRLPVAHGEGKLVAEPSVLEKLVENDQIVFKYARDGAPAEGEFPFNPNGSAMDIAGICDESGRVFGLMPHPERNIFFAQQEDWGLRKEKLKREGKPLPDDGPGLTIFRNAVGFFR
jgi:phosphoribosylformylglycinamidine synthase